MGSKADRFAATSEERKAASAAFNALPLEVRKVCSNLDLHNKLQYLIMERDRAVSAHKKHLREIDAHIKTIIGAIKRRYQEEPNDR